MKRKVRSDFDPEQSICMDVSSCTVEEKKEVQQAFFDAGFPWENRGEVYQYLNAAKYSNTTDDGVVTAYCMYGRTTTECNMTPKEFLDLVYEPQQQGHVHAENMALYAEDAKTTDKPWKLWQINVSGEWRDLTCDPSFAPHLGYRRKPKTKLIHGVDVPNISFTPNDGEEYVYPNIYGEDYASASRFYRGYEASEMALKAGCCYPHTEEGTKAAILHAKAMIGIV